MKTIQDHKKEATLNKLIRYEEGVMTRREWLKLQLVKGAIVEQSTKNRIDFNRIKFNRMGWSEQAEYEKKCAEKVVCYKIREAGQSSYYEITKTEYDYFLDLQLAEGVNTEKHDLENRIEAGIATEKEINEDMQTEMDFINKYYN